MKPYPSTSFSGATAFVQIAGSIGSSESGGSCTMMPWIVESLFNSSTALRTLRQKCNTVSAQKSVAQNFKGITFKKLLIKLSCWTMQLISMGLSVLSGSFCCVLGQETELSWSLFPSRSVLNNRWNQIVWLSYMYWKYYEIYHSKVFIPE